MTRTLLTLALASSAMAVAPAFAQDTAATGSSANASGNYLPTQPVGSGNWFVDANVGRTSGNSDGGFGGDASTFNFFSGHRGRRTGYGLLGGYRWKVGQDLGLGVEAGYTDLGNFRVRNVFNSDPVNQRTTTNALRGWLLGASGRINLTPQWYVGAHAGWFWEIGRASCRERVEGWSGAVAAEKYA